MTQAEFDFLRECLLEKCENMLRKIYENDTKNKENKTEKSKKGETK